MSQMRAAMDTARYARRAEFYEKAYNALEQAMQIADQQKDTHSTTVITLHQADVLIDQGHYDEAEQLLQTVQQAAESVNQRGFIAYALVSMGNLYVGRGEWAQAQQAYEEARKVAAKVEAEGPEGRAIGHLADVYLHDNNASFAIHLLEESLPKLNAAGDLEMSSYFVGRLGEAMMMTGQQAEGRQMLDRALRLGEQMRDQRMIRRWTLAIGDTAYDSDQVDEAYMFYRRALDLLGKDTATRQHAQTYTRLSRISLQLGEKEAALEFAEKGVGSAQAINSPDLLAAAQGALGMALRALGRNSEAIPHLEAAVETASDTVDALHIQSLRHLATVQADAGQPDIAYQTYDRARQLAQEAGLSEPLANVYQDLGLHHANRQQYREAIEIWSKALSIYEEAYNANRIARVLCDIANVRRQLGQTKRALTDYENALVALNHVDDMTTRGLILANAANAYTDQGDTESAKAFFQDAIDIARQFGDAPAESTRLGNYGWFLIGTGDPRQAIEKLTAAREISADNGMTLHLAIQTDNLGLAYDALSQYKTALGHHEEALTTLQTLDPTPARWEALILANTSRTQIALGLTQPATEQAQQALQLARESNDYEVLVIAQMANGRAQLRLGQPTEAEAHIKEALAIAQRASLRRLLAEAYHLYSEQQAAAGNNDQAEAYWDQAKQLYRMVGAPQARQNPFWLNQQNDDTDGSETQ